MLTIKLQITLRILNVSLFCSSKIIHGKLIHKELMKLVVIAKNILQKKMKRWQIISLHLKKEAKDR